MSGKAVVVASQPADIEEEGVGLSPYLSPLGTWAFGVGAAIGWGSFFVTTNQFLLEGGPLCSVLGMMASTLIMLIIARNYAYMMERYPSAGGAYTYARQVLGHDHGFLVAWFLGLTYLSVFWANASSVPLFASFFTGDLLKVGYLYTIFGYDVYLGEMPLTLGAILFMGALCMLDKRVKQWIMVVLATIFTLGISICFVSIFVSPLSRLGNLDPLVLPGSDAYHQMLSVMLMSPWAFCGFESVSNSTEEFAFSRTRSRALLRAIVVTTSVLYIMVLLLSVSAYPPEYSSWFAYMSDLGNLDGIKALPPLYAAYAHLGQPGVAILMVSLFALVTTSLIGQITGLSRLVMVLARDELAPAPLAKLNEKGAPQNALLALLCISLFVPLLGRTAIGWLVDVSTLSTAIVYGFVSLAVFVAARGEGDKRMEASGTVGSLLMALLGAIVLLPSFFSNARLAPETYFLIMVWSVSGFICYRVILKRDYRAWFGRSTVVWVVLLTMVFFTSTVWLQMADQRVMDDAITEIGQHITTRDERQKEYVAQTIMNANRLNERNSLKVAMLFMVALGLVLGDERLMRKRQVLMDRELGMARQAAYTDALTGVKNKNAYYDWEERVNERIERRMIEGLAVAVCDINDLKLINDSRGHKAGDECIMAASHMICVSFKRSPVFRVGGDEFAVILEGEDYLNRERIMAEFQQTVKENAEHGGTVVAIGLASYRPEVDYALEVLFQRADDRMYEDKSRLKELCA